MLTEQLLVSHQPPSNSAPVSATSISNASQVDATIVLYDLHSSNTAATYKRTNTAPQCLAVTPTHILAGQADRAVVNIYNRTKEGALETTVPFQEKWSVLVASGGGHLVAAGTESGRIGVWELTSGRIIYSGRIHLQKVTTITFDGCDQFLITGSADTNIFVWSLPVFLDLGNAALGHESQNLRPERILGHHQREVTDIVCGKGRGPANILVSSSRDLTVAMWNYHNGTLLRRFTLNAVPNCLAMDPADRVVYVGLEDGGVQCIDFHGDMDHREHQMFVDDDRKRNLPVLLQGGNRRWAAPGHDSPIISIGVASTGECVVTGSQSGSVCLWDVATGGLYRSICTSGQSGKGPISNLKILPLQYNDQPTSLGPFALTLPTKQDNIVKPRYGSALPPTSSALSLESYTISTCFVGILPETHVSPFHMSRFEEQDENDMDMIIQGATAMSNHDMTLSSKNRTQALESELGELYEAYDRLGKLQKKTWEAYANLAMEEVGNMSNKNSTNATG